MSSIIKIKNLSKSYEKRLILEQINLEIESGEFLCIIGPSGCGKSTLLNLMGGFMKPDSGVITLQDKPVKQPSRDCIMVFQEFDQLFPWQTVQQNLEFPLKNDKKKYAKEKIRQLSNDYLEMVKLKEFSHFYPQQLSGGMKQRVAIARSLVTTPKVLLMDEPFGSLDFQTKSELHQTLLEIWKKTQTTIVFVTHDVREALELADRIVILKDGVIKQIIPNQNKDQSEAKMNEIIKYHSP
ncbi:ABC transporter ATP-binding protein [Acetobacterium woodii]|nr:ABC transporter ATP-binding protein [Acetobacterium woodii]